MIYGVVIDYFNEIYVGDLAGDILFILVNFNLNIVYCVNLELSLGFGFDLVVVKVKLICYKGGLVFFMGGGNFSDNLIGMMGEIFVLGWNIGVFYELDE